MITYVLMGLNVLVFLLMWIGGMNPIAPQVTQVFDWGGATTLSIVEGQWWRLFSYMFIHFGAVHLLANLYALFMVGRNLERLIGKGLFLMSYLVTGIFAGLVSFWGHKNSMVVSAGASGAIAGIFGLFFVLLLTPIIDERIRRNLLKQMGLILAMNVAYGLSNGGGIDHYAHIGGLLSGALLGGLFVLLHRAAFKWPQLRRMLFRMMVAVPITTLLVAAPLIIYKNNDTSHLKFVKLAYTLDEYQRDFEEKWEGIDFQAPPEKVLPHLREAIFPEIKRTEALAEEFNQLELGETPKKLCDYFNQLIALRNERFLVMLKAYEEEEESHIAEFERLTKELEIVVKAIESPQ